MTSLKIVEKLNHIQQDLNAPKNQTNEFASFNYRKAEDILQAVKPLLDGMIITLSDEMVEVGGRVYVKATANLIDGEHELNVTAFARETLTKKGMDEAQITGAASSYARKYALNGMFAIDDNKDPDSMDNSKHDPLSAEEQLWVDAVNNDPAALETITDPILKAKIKEATK